MEIWVPKWADPYDEHVQAWYVGVLFRWGSAWVGAHYAANHKRLCINLIPFVTIWIVAPGGDIPK